MTFLKVEGMFYENALVLDMIAYVHNLCMHQAEEKEGSQFKAGVGKKKVLAFFTIVILSVLSKSVLQR